MRIKQTPFWQRGLEFNFHSMVEGAGEPGESEWVVVQALHKEIKNFDLSDQVRSWCCFARSISSFMVKSHVHNLEQQGWEMFLNTLSMIGVLGKCLSCGVRAT